MGLIEISLTRGCRQISDMFFADDTFLFSKGNPESCNMSLILLVDFQDSGQQLNIHKSYFKLGSNTQTLEQQTFKAFCKCSWFQTWGNI